MSVVVGSSDCPISKVVFIIISKAQSSSHFSDIARELRVPTESISRLESDLQAGKIRLSDVVSKLVNEWVKLCGTQAHLDELMRVLGLYGLDGCVESLRNAFVKKNLSSVDEIGDISSATNVDVEAKSSDRTGKAVSFKEQSKDDIIIDNDNATEIDTKITSIRDLIGKYNKKVVIEKKSSAEQAQEQAVEPVDEKSVKGLIHKFSRVESTETVDKRPRTSLTGTPPRTASANKIKLELKDEQGNSLVQLDVDKEGKDNEKLDELIRVLKQTGFDRHAVALSKQLNSSKDQKPQAENPTLKSLEKQRAFVTQHLMELLESTCLDSFTITLLQSKDILTAGNVAMLDSIPSIYEKNKAFYSMIMEIPRSLEVLLEATEKTGQAEASSILSKMVQG